MTEAAHARGEDFGGDDEGGGVGAEVEEKLCVGTLGVGRLRVGRLRVGRLWVEAGYLSESETDKLPTCAHVIVVPGNDGEHQCNDQEPLNLYPPSS